ncbi:MAG: T9SS type A sorting domain-containing protein [Melioribacteraceae bacterium]|nr:T9SS type A sorting domain-containing protein [Melioribacteraceae bacterium]
MIEKNTLSLVNVLLIMVVAFFIGAGNILGQGELCSCDSGTEVKFEWNDDTKQFDLAEGNATGIEIIDVQYKDGEQLPECVTWKSSINFVTQACVKAGSNAPVSEYYNINDYDLAVGQIETICTIYQQAISNFVLCVDGPLPVEMTSFSVNVNNNLAELNWETATEVNNYGFEVQRAYEALDWNKIGFVEGHGNSNSPKSYSFKDASVSESGKYYYRLKQIDIDGQYEYSDVVEIDFATPMDYNLNQNYPNPFNPSTTISYSIPEQTFLKLTVYNVFGEEVQQLVNGVQEAGSYTIGFNGENLASGMYFYTLETDKFTATKKLLLLK